MLNVSNNHFEFKSSVQLPKKAIFNLMGIKMAKKCCEIFLASILTVTRCPKH